MKRLIYHATVESNLQSILEKGLIPRESSWYEHKFEELLGEFGFARKEVEDNILYPRWVSRRIMSELSWTLESRVGYVSCSAQKSYALGNGKAGLEFEILVKQLLYMLSHKPCYGRHLRRWDIIGRTVPQHKERKVLFVIDFDKVKDYWKPFGNKELKDEYWLHYSELRFSQIPARALSLVGQYF